MKKKSDALSGNMNMENNFDVIVIGGGPAGGMCALELAKKGIRVLLVEKFRSFSENNFSSAGMLVETLRDFSLPIDLVASYWSDFVVQSSFEKYSWKGKQGEGIVLDFAKLKQYLADECQKYGGTIWMGHRYEFKEILTGGIRVCLTDLTTNSKITCEAALLIDATGPARKVMYDKAETQPEMLVGTGVEYLVEVSDEVYGRFKNDLTFFLGEKWADMGYSWIFPMDNNTLKVGSGRLVSANKNRKDLKVITENILTQYMGANDYKVLDVHGGSLRYSLGMKDVFYRDRVLAVGDAVSTVNPLGGEGIRYAMENAQMAVPYIERFVKTGSNKFNRFKSRWKRKYYLKWLICEILCLRIYLKYTDEKLDTRFSQYRKLTDFEDVKNNFFRFNFSNFRWKIFGFLFKKLIRR
ncbi:MAG: NAD(P)/FAD-dependent oxidoreductase [Bacteroidota bacterium]